MLLEIGVLRPGIKSVEHHVALLGQPLNTGQKLDGVGGKSVLGAKLLAHHFLIFLILFKAAVFELLHRDAAKIDLLPARIGEDLGGNRFARAAHAYNGNNLSF